MDSITRFCEIDGFFWAYEKWIAIDWLPEAPPETRRGQRHLSPSETMTLLMAFHQSEYRTFKHFYQRHVCIYWDAAFPQRVGYRRFVQLKKEVLGLLVLYLSAHLVRCSGVSFVDSTQLRVCKNKDFAFHQRSPQTQIQESI